MRTANEKPQIPMAVSDYSAAETLRDGRRVEIRALRPSDRDAMLTAVGKMSPEALYRRFFAPKRSFTEKEIDFYLSIDFVNHVALVAVLEGVIVGGCRYIVTTPGSAEVAFSVEDAIQGQGVGSALMRHLAGIARRAGLAEFTAEVLPDNAPMLGVFARCGLTMKQARETGSVHVRLSLAA